MFRGHTLTPSGSSYTDTPCYRNVLNPRGAVQLLETHGHSTRQKTCPTFQASFREYKLRGRAVESYFVAIFERLDSKLPCFLTTHIHTYRRPQTLNPFLRIGAPGKTTHIHIYRRTQTLNPLLRIVKRKKKEEDEQFAWVTISVCHFRNDCQPR